MKNIRFQRLKQKGRFVRPMGSCVLISLFTLLFTTQLWGQEIAAANTINVHTVKNKVFVARVTTASEWHAITTQGAWKLVKFKRPTVPVWASEDYVDIVDNRAKVRVSRLNARTQASLGASIINKLPLGYSAEVQARRNGFVQIAAPADWTFSISSSANAISADDQDVVEKSVWTVQQDTSVQANTINSDSVDQASEDVPPLVAESPTTSQPSDSQPEKLHRIAPGDTISLLVFGETDLSISNVRVPQSGAVSFPLIGSTLVAGKTTEQVEDLVRAALAGGYINNPKLSVTIDSYRPIFIRGAVRSTGAFPFTEGLTVAQALAVAGGTKNSAKNDGVSILRNGATVHEGLTLDSQARIFSGDIITIAEEVGVSEEANFYVYLHGEVKAPGEYQFRRGLTVEKAIVLAGGFTLRASKKRISVSRMVEGELEPQKLRKVKLYLPVEPGDIIDVGASFF